MRHLNAFYSQGLNRRHGLVGHVFQGRYKAILVQRDNYLLELARYIVLNPVCAGMVATADEWNWSSHNAVVENARAPKWLSAGSLLGQFGDSAVRAVAAYQLFVSAGYGKASPLSATRHQSVLGDEAFVARHSDRLGATDFTAVTKIQRGFGALSLAEYGRRYSCRDEAMARAYCSTAFTMAEIGQHFGVGYKTVGRAIRRYEGEAGNWARGA